MKSRTHLLALITKDSRERTGEQKNEKVQKVKEKRRRKKGEGIIFFSSLKGPERLWLRRMTGRTCTGAVREPTA